MLKRRRSIKKNNKKIPDLIFLDFRICNGNGFSGVVLELNSESNK